MRCVASNPYLEPQTQAAGESEIEPSGLGVLLAHPQF